MIDASTAEAVLERLGVGTDPTADLAGLTQVYGAWCRTVPFDNLEKRIHIAAGDPRPFPNIDPQHFFDSFLEHGTGATCWPSALALFALLTEVGFEARLASAAMADAHTGPIHTHGTVIVRVDGDQYWVDSSMLTDRPVPLVVGEATTLDHPLRPVRAEPVEDLWRVWWKPGNSDAELGCLLLDDDVTVGHYQARYEASRSMSIFNDEIYATANRDDAVVSVCIGQHFHLDRSGLRATPIGEDRDRILVEELGYSEAIVSRLPPDEPNPDRVDQ